MESILAVPTWLLASSIIAGILIVAICFAVCYQQGYLTIKRMRTESHLASCETEQSIVTVKSFPENYSPQIPTIKVDAYQYTDPSRLSNGSTSKPLLKKHIHSDGMTEI